MKWATMIYGLCASAKSKLEGAESHPAWSILDAVIAEAKTWQAVVDAEAGREDVGIERRVWVLFQDGRAVDVRSEEPERKAFTSAGSSLAWIPMYIGSGSPPRALRAEIREEAEKLVDDFSIALQGWIKAVFAPGIEGMVEAAKSLDAARSAILAALLAKPGEARSAEPEQSPPAPSQPSDEAIAFAAAVALEEGWLDRADHPPAPQSPSSIQVQGATGSPAPSALKDAVWVQFLPGGGANVYRTAAEVEEFASKSAPCLPYVPAPESPAEGRAGV